MRTWISSLLLVGSATLVAACGEVTAGRDDDLVDGGAIDDGGPDAVTADDGAPPDAAPGAGALAASRTEVDFGVQPVGTAASPEPVEITNSGGAAVGPLRVLVEGSGFTVAADGCSGAVLEPGASCTVSASFQPAHVAAFEAALVVDDAAEAAVSITLRGEGGQGALAGLPSADPFGTIGLATSVTRAYEVTNAGAVATADVTASIAGSAAFTITSSTCDGPLAPGATCALSVRFRPTTLGSHAATLTVSDGISTLETALSGAANATLSVTKNGTGAGTVTGPGLSCGSTCSTTVTSSPITLQASAASGSRFAGWSIASCGTSSSCSVPIQTATTSVTATFADLLDLRVSVVNGTGALGRVRVSPPDQTCSGTCTFTYQTTTSVTLSALASQADCTRFDGWSGACTGTSSTCSLTVSSDRSVTASFSRISGCVPQ